MFIIIVSIFKSQLKNNNICHLTIKNLVVYSPLKIDYRVLGFLQNLSKGLIGMPTSETESPAQCRKSLNCQKNGEGTQAWACKSANWWYQTFHDLLFWLQHPYHLYCLSVVKVHSWISKYKYWVADFIVALLRLHYSFNPIKSYLCQVTNIYCFKHLQGIVT